MKKELNYVRGFDVSRFLVDSLVGDSVFHSIHDSVKSPIWESICRSVFISICYSVCDSLW